MERSKIGMILKMHLKLRRKIKLYVKWIWNILRQMMMKQLMRK